MADDYGDIIHRTARPAAIVAGGAWSLPLIGPIRTGSPLTDHRDLSLTSWCHTVQLGALTATLPQEIGMK
jgi:hypothetical protein